MFYMTPRQYLASVLPFANKEDTQTESNTCTKQCWNSKRRHQ